MNVLIQNKNGGKVFGLWNNFYKGPWIYKLELDLQFLLEKARVKKVFGINNL